MVNFHDPAIIAQDALVSAKLWYTVSGLYIWEFVTTLGYEWSVIRGRLPYRWTIWIYSFTRVAALLAIILGFILIENAGPFNCQAVVSFVLVFSFSTMSASSLLIVLRIIAIWDRNKIVVATAMGVWGINAAILIQGAVRLRAERAPAQSACIPSHTRSSALNASSMLVTDIALLFIMLLGLFRIRRYGGGTFGLSQFLWRQGVIWILIATAAEVPPVVFIYLDLNEPLNLMFQPLAWITMSIAATRIHRSLVDFASGSTEVHCANESLLSNSLPVPKKRIRALSPPLDRREVVVHVVSGQHSASQTRDNDSCISIEGQAHEKPNGFSLYDNAERGV